MIRQVIRIVVVVTVVGGMRPAGAQSPATSNPQAALAEDVPLAEHSLMMRAYYGELFRGAGRAEALRHAKLQ